jgi:CRP/FNR family transcriptional regulator, cyclic AMP receptor protein
MSIARLLADTPLFSTLAPDDLAACAAKFREVHFEKGALLFGRGDPGAHLFLVADGQVRLATATAGGRELSFQIAVAGDVFGEIALLDGWPRSAEATALTAVTAHILERSAFRELWSQHPAITDAVVAFLCRRLRDISDKLEGIALYPLEARLAKFLLVALGDQQPPPGRRLPLQLGYSQGELGLLLGASRPKINAALGALEQAGAIGRTQDRMFCDPAKLALVAQRSDA